MIERVEVPSRVDFDAIERFVGYGNASAPVVFVGIEEKLDRDADVRQELELRSRYTPVMDLHEAQDPSATASNLRRHVPTWVPMCDLMLRRCGTAPDLETRKEYQVNDLGRSNGDTLLCELLPYANVSRTDWAYNGISRFSNRNDYEATVLPSRISLLRHTLGAYPRDLIVCYGKQDWSHYMDLFPGASWTDVGAYRVTTIDSGARVLLTKHFGRWFNTRKTLESFAAAALES